jgi:predicted RNA methylase
MSKRPNDTAKRELTRAEKKQRDLSQWFTGPSLARRLWLWASMSGEIGNGRPISVLEPTCGLGGLLVPILELGIATHRVCAIDIDPKNTKKVRSRFEKHIKHLVTVTDDFLAVTPRMIGGFDLAVVNLPFEDNAHVELTEHAFKFTDRVVGIYPADVTFSAGREDFWAWHDIVREAKLIKRPKFGGRFTPMTNFVVLDLRRRQHRRKDGEATPMSVEWWG